MPSLTAELREAYGEGDPFRISKPWSREAEWQFHEHEWRLIRETYAWAKPPRNYGSSLEGASFYVVGIELGARIAAAAHQQGLEIGLAAVYNNGLASIPALIPHGGQVPPIDTRIRVIDARWTVVRPVARSTFGESFLIIEKWEPEHPLQAYGDGDATQLPRLVEEALGTDSLTASVHALPLLSSSPIGPAPGGIDAATDTFGLSATQVNALQSRLRELTPPEERPWPDGAARKGTWIPVTQGVRFNVGQRPPRVPVSLNAFTAGDAMQFLALLDADKAGVEESRLANLRLLEGRSGEKTAVVLGHARADAALPTPLDDVIDVPTALRTLPKYATSITWGAVAQAHLKPTPLPNPTLLGPYVDGVLDRYDGELEPYLRKEKDRRAMVTVLARNLPDTLWRIASGWTRASKDTTITTQRLKQAHDVRIQLIERLFETRGLILQNIAKEFSSKHSPEYRAMQLAIIQEDGILIDELWTTLASHPAFQGNRVPFESALGSMRKNNQVVLDHRGRLHWIGGIG